tara:strand:+ start:1060 stop:2082 length:1023 start_codon:yes stop_codon:yes gene_type:complete
MEKYGKSNKEMLSLKNDFFTNDKQLLKEQLEIGNTYLSQPLRKKCKNCNSTIKGYSFIKQNIKYKICETCSHLNGIYQDTLEFCESMYTDNEGKKFSINSYTTKDYSVFIERVNQVYNPKVEFLLNSLKEQGENINELSFTDFGCGMGHFLKSLKTFNINNIRGLEVSKVNVEMGNYILKENLIEEIDINDFYHKLVNVEVLSMIGVLEHLERPHEFLTKLKNLKNLKYLFISVPTFSLSSFLELTSQKIFNRQLGSDHTHLYTDDSLKYIEQKFDLERVSEWWFGTDILDLYRHTILKIENEETKSVFNNYFIDLIDNLQFEIDKQKKSSEVHILYKIK